MRSLILAVLASCTAGLWSHVYLPGRFEVKEQCVTVYGIIEDASSGANPDGLRHDADGSGHGWVKLDNTQEHYLSPANIANEGGNMVYGVVCKYPVLVKDAESACKNYSSDVTLLPVGTHVRITGTVVMNVDPNGKPWLGIYPVSKIVPY